MYDCWRGNSQTLCVLLAVLDDVSQSTVRDPAYLRYRGFALLTVILCKAPSHRVQYFANSESAYGNDEWETESIQIGLVQADQRTPLFVGALIETRRVLLAAGIISQGRGTIFTSQERRMSKKEGKLLFSIGCPDYVAHRSDELIRVVEGP